MINLYKGVEIDSNYNIVYDVSSDASFLAYLSKYLKQSIIDDFNFMWLTSTSATITIDNGSLDIEECLNFNYLCYENNSKYFYFFVTKSECNSNQSTTFMLSLDVWSTYGYRELATSNPTIYIDRAHCQRWTNKDTINYTLPQMLTSEVSSMERNVVKTNGLFSSAYLVVQCVNSGTLGEYVAKTSISTGVAIAPCIIAPFDSGYTITSEDKAITKTLKASELYDIARNGTIDVSYFGTSTRATGDKLDVVSISVMTLPLLSTKAVTTPYTGTYVKGKGVRVGYYGGSGGTTVYGEALGFWVDNFYQLYETTSTNLSFDALGVIKYPSSPSALSAWDKQVEPKLLAYPFTSFNFIDYHKQYSDYNLYKIYHDKSTRSIYHYNLFGGGTSQDFMCFDDSNVYYSYGKRWGVGEVTNYGDSFGWGTNAYAEWCRNNSTQAQTNLAIGVVGGIIGATAGSVTSVVNPLVGTAGIVGGVSSVAKSIAQYEAKSKDLENIRNSVSQPSSSVSFSQLFNLNLPHGYQIKTIAEEDRNLVSSYFYYHGYAFNSTETFLNASTTRCMFNYLKSSDPLIKSSINESEDIKNKVLDILSKGTEIWSLSFLRDNNKTIVESRGIYANYENEIL
jgi:hypothetical protein